MVRIHFFPAISIHALLAESDDRRRSSAAAFSDFYPRSPCGERPDAHPTLTGKDAKFLSTLSLRRATAPAKAATNDGGDFYPRSPCGERPILGNPCAGCPAISIHALLAESDRPGRRSAHRHLPISIHALLAESDCYAIFCGLTDTNFYPRSPCGERLEWNRHGANREEISIHALLAESDAAARITAQQVVNFYPRSPCGERPSQFLGGLLANLHFYPRSPCGERREAFMALWNEYVISIHALLAESDPT